MSVFFINSRHGLHFKQRNQERDKIEFCLEIDSPELERNVLGNNFDHFVITTKGTLQK